MQDRPESPDDALAREQADRAAAEAGAIGGETPEQGLDPAEHPVAEAGGGVAEGFERAEDDLIENAQHGEGAADPGVDGFATEPESGASGAAYGEADGRDSTQTPDRRAERDAERYETDPNVADPTPRPEDARP